MDKLKIESYAFREFFTLLKEFSCQVPSICRTVTLKNMISSYSCGIKQIFLDYGFLHYKWFYKIHVVPCYCFCGSVRYMEEMLETLDLTVNLTVILCQKERCSIAQWVSRPLWLSGKFKVMVFMKYQLLNLIWDAKKPAAGNCCAGSLETTFVKRLLLEKDSFFIRENW